jgi:predicted 2-oxoglutarate/Fe(II)-dependent dioxygenase YbiX
MFIQYNQGDYFLPHTDTPYTSDPMNARIYTLVIQLSESFDYLGGDLIVDGNIGNRERGSIILFRSNKIHELTEVKMGQINILVCMFPSKDLDLNNKSIL